MLNGSIAASQILLLLLFSSGPWEFNLAPGEPGPTPASLLSVYQPYQCRIRNFTIYPLLSRARCRAVSTILFILAAVVAEGWLVSNGSHFPAGHSHTCLHCSDSSHWPGERFEISSCQEKLPRSTEASKLPSFMDSSAVACIIPSWEEPARNY